VATSFKNLARQGAAKILITSRRDKALLKALDEYRTLSLTSDHIQRDIQTYVPFKMERSPRLSNPLIVDLVEEALVHFNNGMFLWARLVRKELKACLSVEQIRQTLLSTPKHLGQVYSTIIHRLETSLKPTTADFVRKVLAWSMACARPIIFNKLRTALSQQYRLEGQTLLYHESEFPFSERDIEILCGDLVIIQNGILLPSHYTFKNYIRELNEAPETSEDSGSLSTLTGMSVSLDLAKVCVTFFAEKFSQSTLHQASPPWFEEHRINIDESGLLNYSCQHWIQHAIESPAESANDLARLLYRTLTPTVTHSWIEQSLILDSRGLWRLSIGLEELNSYFVIAREKDLTNEEVVGLCHWCTNVQTYLSMYGTAFTQSPHLVQILELGSLSFDTPYGPVPIFKAVDRETHVEIHNLEMPMTSDTDFERTHLGYQSPMGVTSTSGNLGWAFWFTILIRIFF
jgi:hypothetical protein